MNIKTFPYKGSKRKLLKTIVELVDERGARRIFDGFSGTGIVAAYLRSRGHEVWANDTSVAAYLAAKVFLHGFSEEVVRKEIVVINAIPPTALWLTQHYSGEAERVIRGTAGAIESRPLGFTVKNASKIDAAREYVETSLVSQKEKDAVILSIILGANKVFNGTNDQKSCLSEWQKHALGDVRFELPTVITGPVGHASQEDICSMEIPEVDFVYLDPPYGSGVLYPACYHINDSIALWDRPVVDSSYAIPRPERATFVKKGIESGGFYGKKTATKSMEKLLTNIYAKNKRCRTVISYSDAPRNVINREDLEQLGSKFGVVKTITKDHKLCSQANSLNKISDTLVELFIVIDGD